MVTIRNFELSHLVIELLVCYLCIIDTLSSLVIVILGNEWAMNTIILYGVYSLYSLYSLVMNQND